MSSTRKAIVIFNKLGSKKNIDLSGYLENFSFNDVCADGSDSVSVDLHNLSNKFLNGSMPSKGTQYSATIKLYNWNKEGEHKTLKCGTFTLDDLSVSGRPLEASLGMISAPASSSFSTKGRTKTWKSITIYQIAKQIASRYKLKLVYDAPTIKIKSLEQNNKADSSFLNDLCTTYGIAMKIFAKKLVLYDEGRYEKKKAVRTIKESEIESGWTINDTLSGTYTGCKFSYTDPSTNKTVTAQVGKGSRWLTETGEASSKADAQKKAIAAVNNSNKNMTTISFSIFPDPKLIATACINLTGFGKLNGKYIITKVGYSIANDGCRMSVEARKIQKRLS